MIIVWSMYLMHSYIHCKGPKNRKENFATGGLWPFTGPLRGDTGPTHTPFLSAGEADS